MHSQYITNCFESHCDIKRDAKRENQACHTIYFEAFVWIERVVFIYLHAMFVPLFSAIFPFSSFTNYLKIYTKTY